MLRPPSSSASPTQDELGRRFGCAGSVVTSAVTTRQKNKRAKTAFPPRRRSLDHAQYGARYGLGVGLRGPGAL
jgi:hypothetical protein